MKEKIEYTAPEEAFKELFVDLQRSKVLSDDKQISDAIPLSKPSEILNRYRAQKDDSDFDIKAFFKENFEVTQAPTTGFEVDTNRSIEEHIKALWAYLQREADQLIEGSSLIPLQYPYIVPGGRFNEIYYWDSFFTMLGLKIHGEVDAIENMIKNFAWMINHIGFIPNGNRTYFSGRSQPPYFSLMVCLLSNIKGDSILSDYLDELELEYGFWMNAADESESHLISYKGVSLNRYYDRNEGPRPEMYATDVEDYEKFGKPDNYYKHLRAACESGWDFSCRWFKDPMDLGSINTLNILPVDLNCLLLYLERTIARAYDYKDDSKKAEMWHKRASTREEAIQNLFWNPEQNYFNDINFVDEKHTGVRSLAGLFPLYFRCATKKQAKACAKVIEEYFLKDGGLVSTPLDTGQQWDAPNGWAPLQYISVIGLRNYGFDNLANEIINRWIASNRAIYKKTGKMLEKYNVVDVDQLSEGGEYLVQDGFGWTNGVYLVFKRLQKELIGM